MTDEERRKIEAALAHHQPQSDGPLSLVSWKTARDLIAILEPTA